MKFLEVDEEEACPALCWSGEWLGPAGSGLVLLLLLSETVSSRMALSMPARRKPKWSIFFSLLSRSESQWRETMRMLYYWLEIRTLWRGSLAFWPRPVELHDLWAVRQLEHGDSLSQRICRRPSVGTGHGTEYMELELAFFVRHWSHYSEPAG